MQQYNEFCDVYQTEWKLWLWILRIVKLLILADYYSILKIFNVALSNLSIYYTWKNFKKSYKNNEFKISAPTWNEEFELPDG